MQAADACYGRTGYDAQHELSSASGALPHSSDPRGGGSDRPGPGRDVQGDALL